MTYPIDPELLAWLDSLPDLRVDSHEALSEVRTMQDELRHLMPSYTPKNPITIRDVPEARLRVYTPQHAPEPLPALVYLHGGGFVLGSAEMFDAQILRMVDGLGVVVASVDYRLAPEHPFPAPVEDAYAALQWVCAKADELGVDPRRIGIGGESAGGGLAAATALTARDRGGPALVFQYLSAPVLDDRLDTSSARDYVDTPLWNRPNAIYSWTAYLGGEPGGGDVSPYAAPARATDLSGLPPAFITAGQFDPLRDEGIEYARRLAHAGVPVELRLYPGTFHGSTQVGSAAVTKRMVADETEALRRGLKV